MDHITRILSRLLMPALMILMVLAGCHREERALSPARLLIRCDDIGMCHAVNEAARQLLETGIPFSASVMFVCPWYQEAVDLLREFPDIAVGVHLTLNAEWKNYRWGPVAGAQAVPSLVDSCGYFFPSRKLFFANQPKADEVATELRAQIERALQSGLTIDYVDYHMGTAVSTPEFRRIVEELAHEYQLGISRYFGESDLPNMYDVAFDAKSDTLLAIVGAIPREGYHLLVCHIGLQHPEMNALEDLNTFGLREMSRHRQAELQALCAPRLHGYLRKQAILPLTYRQLITEKGLESMQSPVGNGY